MESTTIEQAYSDSAWWYNIRGYFILRLAYRDTLLRQIRFLERHMSNDHHLEIAVGTGTLLRMIFWLRRMKGGTMPRVVALDYASRMVKSAQQTFQRNSNVTVTAGDATALSFSDNSFSSVSIANSLHCIDDVDAALGQVARVLKPNGIFVATVLLPPRGSNFAKKISDRIIVWGQKKGLLVGPIDQKSLHQKLASHGLQVVEENVRGNSLTIAARK